VDEDGEPVSSAGNGDSKNKMPKRWEANLFRSCLHTLPHDVAGLDSGSPS